MFAKRMGLDNHQWVAVTHKDIDNRHIRLANRWAIPISSDTVSLFSSCGSIPSSIRRNKFLRIEIGIAPQDEKRLPASELMWIAHLFAKRMGLDNHQWVAVTHKDTDNMHIHIIANRIALTAEKD